MSSSSVLNLSVAFDRMYVEEACYRLSDQDSIDGSPRGVAQLDNGILSISAMHLRVAFRNAVRNLAFPDVDFGQLTENVQREAYVKFGRLWADPLADDARSNGEVVFTGRLVIRKGGTLPHSFWRFLMTQEIPEKLRLKNEFKPHRCSCFLDRMSEEMFLASPVLRVMRQATRQLLAIISRDPEQLLEVEHRDLERIMATAAEDLGFDVELTRGSKDGGKDLILRCRDATGGTKIILAEVKHWASGKKVGPSELRDLLTVVTRENADGGVLISTSGFTAPAKQVASTHEVADLVRLIDLDEMVAYFRESGTPSTNGVLPDGILAEVIKRPLFL